MKYNLLLIGPPRTGTTSLWTLLINHPNVSATLIKEPLCGRVAGEISEKEYIAQFFMIHKDTKLLLDGTAFGNENIANISTQIDSLNALDTIGTIKFLNLHRSPIDRAISMAYWSLYLFYADHKFYRVNRPAFINSEGLFIKERFIKGMTSTIENQRRGLISVEEKIGKENMMIIKIGKFQEYLDDLFDFLEIDHADLKLKKINSSYDCIKNIIHFKEKMKITRAFEEFKTTLLVSSILEERKILRNFDVKGA